MNKLQEIKVKWIKDNEDYLLGWGLSTKIIELIADDIIKNSVEYARSVVLPLSIDQNYNLSHMPEIVGYNLCLDHINARINQDSQLLTDKE